MYNGVPTQRSCACAWVAAASAIMDTGDEGYNVVIDVEDPCNHDDSDNAVITLVDKFLKAHDECPVITVANTIFPQALYAEYGAPEFYAVYYRNFDSLTNTKRWGRYFERMTRHQKMGGDTYNPLQDLIDKMRRQEDAGVEYNSAYELTVFDPLRDGRSSARGFVGMGVLILRQNLRPSAATPSIGSCLTDGLPGSSRAHGRIVRVEGRSPQQPRGGERGFRGDS